MGIKNVTVAGSGVLGYQIAFQTAFHDYKVIVYDVNEEILNKAKAKFDALAADYKRDLKATDDQIKATQANLSYADDLKEALAHTDLLIEAIPENPDIKTDFYTKAGQLAPEHTIFATNSSTMLPSQFAKATGRPDRFLALHFANTIWINNTAEIMGQADTSPKVFDTIVDFAKSIGMVALPLKKEQPGYILNSMLVPFLNAATSLLVNGVSDADTIDKTWMIATGAPMGPFAIMDIVGITTVYNINQMQAKATNDPLKIKTVEYLKKNYIDQNKLGVSTGAGFYSYPNPAFKDKDFLKP